MQDKSIIVLNINRKWRAIYQTVSFSMTLNDPNPVFKVMILSKGKYCSKRCISYCASVQLKIGLICLLKRQYNVSLTPDSWAYC